MSTPTDPYSSMQRRSFEEDDVLAPIAPTPSAQSAYDDIEDFLEEIEPEKPGRPTEGKTGTDPAFDKNNTGRFTFASSSTSQASSSTSHDDASSAQQEVADLQKASSNLHETHASVQEVQNALATESPEGKQTDSEVGATSSSPELPSGDQNTAMPRTRRSIFAQSGTSVENAGLPSTLHTPTSPEGTTSGVANPFSTPEPAPTSATLPASPTSTPAQVAPEAPAPDALSDSFAQRAVFAASQPASQLPFEAITETPVVVSHSQPVLPEGRGWTHVGVFIVTLLLVPLAWYLLSDASVRLSLVDNSPWETNNLNFAALAELAGGAVVCLILWLTARASSLGTWFWGLIVANFGLITLINPAITKEHLIAPLDRLIGDYNDFTANVVHHLEIDIASGRIFIFGVILLLTGMVSHSARRRGMKAGDLLARAEISRERVRAIKENQEASNAALD